MASKKSKVLAIAFCAAVMAGIHVNPVLADGIPVKDDGSVTIRYKDFETTPGTGYEENAKVTITKTNIASQTELWEEADERREADDKLATEISQEVVARDEGDKQLQANIDAEADERREADDKLATEISQEVVDRAEGDKQLQDNINAEADERREADDKLATEISQEIVARDEGDKKLQSQIDNVNTVTGAADKADLDAAYANGHYVNGSESMVDADMRLDNAVYEVSNRVDGLENRVDGLEGRIDKVGAMSAAIANLRTMGYDPAAPTEVAVGVGQYRDETGMALGLFHYPNRDFMLSLSVSTSGDEYMGGIGATWKFGRKSPEKVAEIKKAQAEADARRAEEQKLAKAEEMKKAAKEAKVQAQMERHAKMLAEQEAQA